MAYKIFNLNRLISGLFSAKWKAEIKIREIVKDSRTNPEFDPQDKSDFTIVKSDEGRYSIMNGTNLLDGTYKNKQAANAEIRKIIEESKNNPEFNPQKRSDFTIVRNY